MLMVETMRGLITLLVLAGALPIGAEQRRSNVLLVTIDTLRADRVGCYGDRSGATPHLDRLAAEGVRFALALAPTPLTLPSHASLLTGLYPFRTQARDNGQAVAADVTTLAKRLAADGYSTAAVVSSYVLHSRFGLAQGFAIYDDHFELPAETTRGLERLERPAEESAGRALELIRHRLRPPWFLWLHLYDPHYPYAPPEPFRSRFRGRPYMGEVSYSDAQLGRVLEALQASGELDRTLIIATSDHGEGLGEHREPSHGLFVYQSTLQVPLLIRFPDRRLAGRVVETPVSLVDVMPTALALSGATAAEGAAPYDGRRLIEPETRPGSEAVYFESLFPLLHYGWSDLRGVVAGRLKYIQAPRAELYDLEQDPAERTNLIETQPQAAAPLRAKLEAYLAQDPEPRPAAAALDAEVAAKLKALGYAGAAAADQDAGARPDPKDRIDVHLLLQRASEAIVAGRPADAEELLLEVLKREPRLPDAHQALGDALLALGKPEAALAACREVVRLRPGDSLAAMNLGLAHEASRDAAAALEWFERAAELDPHNSQALYNLARLHFEARRWGPAALHLQRAIDSDANLRSLLPDLGRAWLELGELDQAESSFRRAIVELGDRPGLHVALGQVQEARGDLARAIAEYETALQGAPQAPAVMMALAHALERRGAPGDRERAQQLRGAAQPIHEQP
ncbi:MAG TPA: sulfatase-like hydrolase/transferase [Acidobacteriota bacterium]